MTSIEELISQSSLGTPAARQLTRRTPGWVVANVLALAKAPRSGESEGVPPPAASELAPEDAAQLFEAWVGGDYGAIAVLVRKATPVLWQVVAAYGLDRTSAEDVVQTTWLALVRRSDQVPAPMVLWWLATTARREARREARRVAGHGEAVRQAGIGPPESAGIGPPESFAASLLERIGAASGVVDVDLLGEERHRASREAFGQLSARERQLLTLLLHDPPMPYAKVSEQLGIPVGAIGPTRSRALERLRKMLAEGLADPEMRDLGEALGVSTGVTSQDK
jgi:RNA polymerase sigma factor (sigma-70 family)